VITVVARPTFSTGIKPFLEDVMCKMRFDVKCVKECLEKNKIVYTVRSWEGYTAVSNQDNTRFFFWRVGKVIMKIAFTGHRHLK
jgi:hypothetical protein